MFTGLILINLGIMCGKIRYAYQSVCPFESIDLLAIILYNIVYLIPNKSCLYNV